MKKLTFSVFTRPCLSFLCVFRESEKRQKKKLLLDYLYSNLKNHNFWAYRYFFCEFLGILNVVGMLFLKIFLAVFQQQQLFVSNSWFRFIHSRSNVPDGPFFWWNVSNLWYRSDLICGERPGGPHRSDGDDKNISISNKNISLNFLRFSGLHFPAHDQVHFSQVWDEWWDRETRRHVHSAPQYR